jgi:hypothetical protein
MFLFVIVVLWLVGGAWGAKRAVKAGYSELVATVAAIFLGPFAPLLALAKPMGKRCQFCLSVMPELATVCAKCSREQIRVLPTAEESRSPDEVKAALAAEYAKTQALAEAAQLAERARVRERIAADNLRQEREAKERLDAITKKRGG